MEGQGEEEKSSSEAQYPSQYAQEEDLILQSHAEEEEDPVIRPPMSHGEEDDSMLHHSIRLEEVLEDAMMQPPTHAPPLSSSSSYDDIQPPDHDPPLPVLPPRRRPSNHVPRYAAPPPPRRQARSGDDDELRELPYPLPLKALQTQEIYVDDVSAFRHVPDECLDHVLSFLQAPELARCGAICRRFRQRSSLPRLWRRLFLLDFHAFTAAHTIIPPPPGLPLLPSPTSPLPTRSRPPPPPPPSFMRYHHQTEQESTPPPSLLSQELRSAKSSYMKRAQEVEERKQLRGEGRRLAELRESRARKRRRIARVFEYFGYKVLFPLFGACALCLSGLITALLTSSSMSPALVFVPVWILLLFVACALGVGTLLYRKRNDPDSLLHALWDNHVGIATTWMNELVAQFEPPSKRRTFAIASGFALYLLLVTFCVVLACKVAAPSTSLTYTLAFIPSWAFVVLSCLVISPAPSLRDASLSEKQEFAATVLLFLLPLLAFLILLPLYLDGYLRTSLEIVLIPIWFQDALYILFVSVHSIATGVSAGELREIRSNLGYMVLLWAVAAPIVVFEALLCVFVQPGQTSVSPGGLFAPLFLWFSVFTLMFLALLCSGEDSIEDDILLMQQQQQNVAPPPPVRQFQRSYGSRNLPQRSNSQEDLLTRASWAHATNPQFDADAYHHMWDNLMQNFNQQGEAVIEGGGTNTAPDVNSLSDFHRMQLAISRALQDLSQQQAGGATTARISPPPVPPRRPNDNPVLAAGGDRISRRHGVAYYRHNPPMHTLDGEEDAERPQTPRQPPSPRVVEQTDLPRQDEESDDDAGDDDDVMLQLDLA